MPWMWSSAPERCCVTFSSSVFFFLHLCALVAALANRTHALPSRPPPARVRVGVIVDLPSPTGMMLQTTIRMAVEDYYAGHRDTSTKLELQFRDSPAGDAVAAVSAVEDLVTNAQVQAIIGPQAPSEAELVASIGSRAHVPVLSFAATAPPTPPSAAPFLVRTGADGTFHAAPVADVLRTLGWRAAVLVHEDSRLGAGIVPALLDAGATVAHRAAVPADASDDRLDAALYRAVSETTARVFVVHVSPALARRLFRRARKAGMMSRGYVWIATAGAMGGVDVERLTAGDRAAMEGVLVVRPHVQRGVRARNFAARLRAKIIHQLEVQEEDEQDPTMATLCAYDTAWAVAAAVEEANRRGGGSGAALLRAVLDTAFDGLAGEFRLVDGVRLHLPAAYEIVNVVADGARTVGFWTEDSRITQDLHATSSGSGSQKGLKQVVWPGEQSQSGDVPRGWAAASPAGRDLVVAVPVKRGFNQFVDVSSDGGGSANGLMPRVTGYCIDVFDAVMKALQSPSYKYVPFNDSLVSYDQLVRLVPQQKADVVVGDVTITASRMAEVDYTMAFTETGWSMVVAAQTGTRSTSMFFFLKPLTTSLWLASFAFFVFTGFVVWVIEHRINPEFRGTPSQQLGLIFYFSFSTLVFAHKENLESNLSRIVVIVWVFVVLILTSSYTASLTSMLTVQQLRPTVTGATELIRRGDYVGYQEGSFVRGELKKMGFDASKLRSYSKPEQYAEALSRGPADGGVAAVFDEVPYLRLFLSQYCDGYAMVGPVYKGSGFGFVFPKGSAMAPDVSRAIVALTEANEMARIEKKWFSDPGACDAQSGGSGVPGSSSSLSFWSFSGLFLVTGVASGLMLLVYLATFVYRERHELSAAEPVAGAESSMPLLRRLRAWLQHYDSKDTRSPSFKHCSVSVRSTVDEAAKERDGEEQQNAIHDATAPAASPLGGSGDSDMTSAASSPTTPFMQRIEEATVASREIPATSAPMLNSEETQG
ncbi:hypothetical protein U9M48_002683 [Paspalum notatum var. saurae]|uniref:Glutamate receptor n=1 Tax=Paspalum notatum var. saurae TaxID=547442 RepID=A0AAQ3PR66_PASNO